MIDNRYITKDFTDKQSAPKDQIKSPIYFIPSKEDYYKEEWRLITPDILPHVRENVYWISNHGRFYSNLISNRNPKGFVTRGRLNSNGYLEVTLRRDSGSGNGCRLHQKVHRLVMMMFRYIPGCEFLEIDHVDSDKTNNMLYNLDFVDHTVNDYRKYLDAGKRIPEDNELLSREDIFDVFDKYFSGKFTIDDIALSYRVSSNYIYNLIRGYVQSDNIFEYRNQHPDFREELLNGEMCLEDLRFYISNRTKLI